MTPTAREETTRRGVHKGPALPCTDPHSSQEGEEYVHGPGVAGPAAP